MKVMTIKVKTEHPGLPVFKAENFGCLFSDNISPVNYLKNTDSIIDKRWTKFSLGWFNRDVVSVVFLLWENIQVQINFDEFAF